MRNIVSNTTIETLRQSLFEPWAYRDPLRNLTLRRDPADDSRYALQWSHMSNEPLVPQSEFLPHRMLNEYANCPRLIHLMHVEGRWEDYVYTVEGRNVHQRADQLDHVLPDPELPENHTLPEGPSEEAGEPTAPSMARPHYSLTAGAQARAAHEVSSISHRPRYRLSR
jgi:hypothetical protein